MLVSPREAFSKVACPEKNGFADARRDAGRGAAGMRMFMPPSLRPDAEGVPAKSWLLASRGLCRAGLYCRNIHFPLPRDVARSVRYYPKWVHFRALSPAPKGGDRRFETQSRERFWGGENLASRLGVGRRH